MKAVKSLILDVQGFPEYMEWVIHQKFQKKMFMK